MMQFMNYKNATIRKINVSEGIDLNKTSASTECKLSHYWFLKMLDLKLKSMFLIDVMIY